MQQATNEVAHVLPGVILLYHTVNYNLRDKSNVLNKQHRLLYRDNLTLNDSSSTVRDTAHQ